MNVQKVVLQGLRPEDYVHPAEARFHTAGNQDGSLVQKGLSVLNDISIQLLMKITLGKYVEVDGKTAPDLAALVADVCRILNCPIQPKLYVCHEYGLTITVGGTEYVQLLVPDYILTAFDQDMLYYVFGNAIAMIHSDHVKLATVCSVLGENPATLPFKLVLEACMRAADLTSDRGGLLCCQSFPAAARCLLAEAGMPLGALRGLDEGELLSLTEEFLALSSESSPDMLTQFSSLWKRMNRGDSPAFYRLRELYNWYRNGYPQVIGKWTGGEERQ